MPIGLDDVLPEDRPPRIEYKLLTSLDYEASKAKAEADKEIVDNQLAFDREKFGFLKKQVLKPKTTPSLSIAKAKSQTILSLPFFVGIALVYFYKKGKK